jgi:hypothetical protein
MLKWLLTGAACLSLAMPIRGEIMADSAATPAVERRPPQQQRDDWLIKPSPQERAEVVVNKTGVQELTLTNGLIRRVFRTTPNAATVAFDNLMTGESLLRAVKPEATLQIDGKEYAVGGLVGQPDLAYLRPAWLDSMHSDPQAFHFTGFDTGKTQPRFAWRRARHSADLPWPPPGASLALHFAPPPGALPGVEVTVHYELYDGLPLLAKWVTVHNGGAQPVRLNSFRVERLGVVERESIVDETDRWEYSNITAVTDYSFGGMSVVNSTKTIFWEPDPGYGTQVNYNLKTPCVLEARTPLGPDVDIAPGAALDTFRVFELIHDSTDRERRGLAVRRMYRALAPWATENPLMMHLTSTDKATAHRAIDQCAECGFEMVILSFGSGLNMEDVSPANIARYKELADYAHSKGVQLGGYSLLASRAISPQDDVINPKTGTTGGAIFGNSPCLGSKWGIQYFEHIQTFLDQTGFDLLEHDGSYPGDRCASTMHPGHRGLSDSQWTQYQRIAAFYRRCRERGVFLNVPDWYFLVGSNKTGMGYRETNWSLPRAEQHIHARQNLYDGTWEKTPTMGWMFVPLVEYQGGGAAATIEPLKDHLADYERHLANNLGYGAQACYRGPRLYDSEETRAAVIKWVTWYKAHRAILESDIIHLRRADARDMDGILHVNPALPEKGLAVFYNPTEQAIEREITLPLYYTGLHETAHIAEHGEHPQTYTLDRAYNVRLKVTIPPAGMTWFVIR